MSEDGYSGPVTVLVGGAEVSGEAVLRVYFEPIDGRYHWYGRLAPSAELDELVATGWPVRSSRRSGGAVRAASAALCAAASSSSSLTR